MKSAFCVAVLTLLVAVPASSVQTNPVQKVLEMLSDLQAKILAEGQDAQKVYEEFAEWCEDRSKDLGFEIKTGKAEVADLKACIAEQSACIAEGDDKLASCSGDVATDEADLKAAKEIRDKEAAAFAKEEKE